MSESIDNELLPSVPPPPRQPTARARSLGIFSVFGSSIGVLLFIGIPLLVLGIPLAVVFCWGLPVDLSIDLSVSIAGTETSGIVLSSNLLQKVTLNGRHPYEIKFRFESGSTAYEGSSRTFDNKSIGAKVRIEYAGFQPHWARIAGSKNSLFGYLGLVAIAVPAFGAALVLPGLLLKRRRVNALLNGLATMARVVFSGQDMTTTINGEHPWKVKWEFEVEGRIYSGSIESMLPERLADLLQAKEIPILYIPGKPSINTVWIE